MASWYQMKKVSELLEQGYTVIESEEDKKLPLVERPIGGPILMLAPALPGTPSPPSSVFEIGADGEAKPRPDILVQTFPSAAKASPGPTLGHKPKSSVAKTKKQTQKNKTNKTRNSARPPAPKRGK